MYQACLVYQSRAHTVPHELGYKANAHFTAGR
jgi:hypothetical protein